MPTYEYGCPDCGNQFEKFQKMSDIPEAACPACGAAAVRRLSGGAGLLFKGSGFYITDYRDSSYKKASESDSSGGSKGDRATDGGSKSSGDKPAAKPAETKKKADS
jgi:putative FmdB family regulatory protein